MSSARPDGVSSMSSENIEFLTLRDVIRIYVRWWKLALVTFVALIVPAVIGIFLVFPLHEATASLWVDRNSPQSGYSVQAFDGSPTTTFRNLDRQEEVATYAEMIKARVNVEAMVDELDLSIEQINRIRDARRFVKAVLDGVLDGARFVYSEFKYLTGLSRRPTPAEAAFLARVNLIDEAVERVRVAPTMDSNIIKVSFRSSDPELAQKAVNSLVDQFLSFYGRLREVRARSFFSEVTEDLGAELAEAERQLSQLRAETSFFNVDQQRGLLLSQLGGATQVLRQLQVRKAEIEGRITALRERLESEPERVVVSETVRENPINQGQRARERATIELNPVYQQVKEQLIENEITLAALAAQTQEAQDVVGSYRDDLAALDVAAIRLREAERNVQQLEEAYEHNLRNREEARIGEEMSMASLSNVRLVDYAPFPLKPIRPRKFMYLGIALGACLLVALAMPFLAHMNDTTIVDEADVRRFLGVDFVVAFPSGSFGRPEA
jgi:succinoglycan biosynthesis transport protein ExoP